MTMTTVLLGIERPILPIEFTNRLFRPPWVSEEISGCPWANTPTTIDWFERDPRWGDYFRQIVRVCDEGSLILRPTNARPIAYSGLCSEVRRAMKTGECFDASIERYCSAMGWDLNQLLEAARQEVINEFNELFFLNRYARFEVKNELRREHEGLLTHYPVFLHPHYIDGHRRISLRGHGLSEFFAGYFLATESGGYDAGCIDHLVRAHELQHPEAMTVLAWYLLFRQDYLGSVQCALLTMHGGGDANFARRIIKAAHRKSVTRGRTQGALIQCWEDITRVLLQSEFGLLFENYVEQPRLLHVSGGKHENLIERYIMGPYSIDQVRRGPPDSGCRLIKSSHS